MHIPGNSPLSPVNVKTFPFPFRVPVNLPTISCSSPLDPIHSKIPPSFARFITYLSLGIAYPSSLIIRKIRRLSQWSAVLYPTAFAISSYRSTLFAGQRQQRFWFRWHPAIRSLFSHRPTCYNSSVSGEDPWFFTPCL